MGVGWLSRWALVCLFECMDRGSLGTIKLVEIKDLIKKSVDLLEVDCNSLPCCDFQCCQRGFNRGEVVLKGFAWVILDPV